MPNRHPRPRERAADGLQSQLQRLQIDQLYTDGTDVEGQGIRKGMLPFIGMAGIACGAWGGCPVQRRGPVTSSGVASCHAPI